MDRFRRKQWRWGVLSERWNFSYLLLNIFSFLLLFEWIWPIKELSGTAEIWVFLVFLSVCFILSFFPTPFMINISIKGIAIVFLLHEIYYVGDFLQFQWVTPFLIEIKSNIDYLFSGNWVGLTHLFRSLLFFILLAFMVYLLQYWLIQRKKIFPFFLLTTVYITILDTFTAYDASWAIVRTVLSGFLMMGILTLQRLRKNGKN